MVGEIREPTIGLLVRYLTNRALQEQFGKIVGVLPSGRVKVRRYGSDGHIDIVELWQLRRWR